MARFTTVPEMGNKVNALYYLLAEAKKIASGLHADNIRNRFALMTNQEDAISEQRPLTIPERIEEADKYRAMFYDVETRLAAIEDLIGRTY